MFTKTGYFQCEKMCLPTANPLLEDYSKPMSEITEAIATDLKLSEIGAIYPLTEAMHSNKITGNFTLYPSETLRGNSKKNTGYTSWVQPYGKPIIREHRLQDSPYHQADPGIGRAIASSYSKRSKDEVQTPNPKRGYPGTLEGDGVMSIISAITDQEGIRKIIGNIHHTVSIGSVAESVWESISGVDLVKARSEGDSPSYERGQIYDGKLSYWSMGPIKGKELSYVNNPSNENAATKQNDLGLAGVRLLLADKKTGTKEFNFFDAATGEKIAWNMEDCAFDTSYIEDSAKVGRNVWWINGTERELNHGVQEIVNESLEPIKIGDCVRWTSNLTGTLKEIKADKFELNGLKYEATELIGVIETPSKRLVAHKLSRLTKVK